MAQSGADNFHDAMHTLLNTRFQKWESTEEMLNHIAWGFRNWLKGEMVMASHLNEVLSKLKTMEEKLERLDRVRGLHR